MWHFDMCRLIVREPVIGLIKWLRPKGFEGVFYVEKCAEFKNQNLKKSAGTQKCYAPPLRKTPVPLVYSILIKNMGEYEESKQKVSEYDQEIPQSHIADQPKTPRGRATKIKSHKTSMDRYIHYTDLTRSRNMIIQQSSGLCPWIL